MTKHWGRNLVRGALTLVPLTIATALPDSSRAQVLPAGADCSNPTDAVTRRVCSQRAYESAEAELKQVYQQTLDAARPNDAKARLTKSQIAWYEYRESDCAFVVNDASPAAQRQNQLDIQARLNQCRERLTRDRIQVLQSYTGTLTNLPQTGTTPAPNPAIGNLPDGNYRYTSTRHSTFIVTDAELLQTGGAIFWFRKQGNQVVGAYGLIDGEAVCLQGTANGNTVTGRAFPADGFVGNTSSTFTAWDPAGYLRVRSGQPAIGRYNGALLDLNTFSRINAGNQAPPTRCPF